MLQVNFGIGLGFVLSAKDTYGLLSGLGIMALSLTIALAERYGDRRRARSQPLPAASPRLP